MSRAIIVDDDRQNLYFLRSLLNASGFEVEEAAHGIEALEKARRRPPDIVISDLLMPEQDGFTLLRHWKADERLKSIPFVVYTATYVDPRDERFVLDLGADAFILKPAEPEAFLGQIRDVLKQQQMGKSADPARPRGDEVALLEKYGEVVERKLREKASAFELANQELRAEIAVREKTEQALRESEDRYRRLFHAFADPILVYDRETLRYVAVSDSAVAHYGYSREEFLQMTAKDIRPPDEVPAFLKAIAVQRSERGDYGVWRHRKKSGEIIDVEISAFGLEFDGRPAFMVHARDVTEARRVEAEAARMNDLLRAVAEGTPDSVFVKDQQGKYLLLNAAAARAVGQPAEEVIGKYDSEIFGPEDAATVIASDELVMRTNQAQTVEEQLRLDGKTRFFQTIKAPHRNAKGEVIGVIGIARDVTEKKLAEQALRLRDRAIQAVSQGLIITDPNQSGNPIIFVSPSFERITGYSSEEALGKNCRFLQGKETDQETVQAMRDAIAERRPCVVDILNYRKDGSPFWNSLSIDPVFDESGAVLYFVGVQNDITERKTLEEQLRRAQKMEAVGRLAGGVAHDFNNLLTIIMGYSELLLAHPELSPSLQELVNAISEAGNRAATLTRQLLGFSRQTIMQPQVIDLNAVIASTAKLLRRLIGEDIEFTTVLAPELNRVKVDPGQLDQVLMNLVVNARDAMPTGGKLTIETASVELSEEYAATHLDVKPGRYVMLAITDTGCGMTAEVKSRLFEPFFTTKKIGEGTGLGLPVVLGIVQQSGGSINVYSEPGHGTTFKIYLPAVDDPATPKNPTATSRAHGTETVLLVEDEEAVRSLAAMSLRQQGYEVLTADCGQDALRVAMRRQGPLDLLLTDVVMPNVSGPALADAIKARFPRLRVLYMSGYTDDAVVRHGLLEANVSFIQKPFTPIELARKVRQVLDRPGVP